VIPFQMFDLTAKRDTISSREARTEAVAIVDKVDEPCRLRIQIVLSRQTSPYKNVEAGSVCACNK
jgi:hypothetical protein